MRDRIKCHGKDTDLDVTICLSDDHRQDILLLEVFHKVSIERMEIVLNTGTFHHHVLRHPWHEVIADTLDQLRRLLESNNKIN